ncbi:MAG: transcription termination/antitermination protein NusG [Pirellulaceae bacterium]|nr:transcription termination/antitermination protein NusG [Pirellulaceae bacterium]
MNESPQENDLSAKEPAVEGLPSEEPSPTEPQTAQEETPLPTNESTVEEPEENSTWNWYILKVQSNRENSAARALERRVKMEGLDEYFGEVIVPMEDVVEFRNGKRKITKRKLYPGYIVVHMELNDDTWFLVRETPGVGDFTGATGKPAAMLPHEVERIIKKEKKAGEGDEKLRVKIPFVNGDRVRVNEGNFTNFEGEVESIDESNGRVTVIIQIFGRSTPVELEHQQIEKL